MFPEHGFIDTITDFSNVNHDSSLAKIFINPYAAVPSMHCAFALMIAVTGVDWSAATGGRRPSGPSGRCSIVWVVIVTANHYWVDAALGCDGRRRLGRWSPRASSPALRPEPGPGATGAPTKRRRSAAASSDSLTPMEPSAPPRAPAARSAATAATAQELRAYARERLIESRLTPNAISMAGLVGNLVAAVLVTQRLFFLAGVAFIVGSVMDTLDGRYSRMSGKGTLFGAFLDSTLDRIEEGIVLAAVAGYFAASGDDFAAAMCVVAVLGSLMVSYTRARAEALGVECKVGIGDAAGPGGAYFRSAWSSPRAPGSAISNCWRRRSTLIAALTSVHRRSSGSGTCETSFGERRASSRRRRDRGCNQRRPPGVLLPPSPIEEDFRIHEREQRSTTAHATAPAARTRRSASRSSASATAPTPSSRASSTTRTPTPPRKSRA